MSYRSVFRSDLFSGKAFIVTGGGSGIGRCTAHELSSLGAEVFLIGRTAQKLNAVVGEIAETGGRAVAMPCDIREPDKVIATVSSVLERAGRIDGLVNNAGGQFVVPLAEMSLNALNALWRNNFVGAFLFSRACFDAWMRDNGGAVVNVLADYGRGMPGLAHSGASRAALGNFTMSASVEWARYGIRVNSVSPGYVASSGLDSYPDHMRSFFEHVHEAVPLQRQAHVAEISGAICFLLSDAAAFITGANIQIDGGASLVRPLTPWAHMENRRDGAPSDFPRPLPRHHQSKPFDGFPLESAPDFFKRS